MCINYTSRKKKKKSHTGGSLGLQSFSQDRDMAQFPRELRPSPNWEEPQRVWICPVPLKLLGILNGCMHSSHLRSPGGKSNCKEGPRFCGFGLLKEDCQPFTLLQRGQAGFLPGELSAPAAARLESPARALGRGSGSFFFFKLILIVVHFTVLLLCCRPWYQF